MIGMNIAGIKSLEYVNLSLYTLFSMLGGMLMPVAYGICTGETITWLKGIGLAVLATALLLAVHDTGKPGLIGALCCIGVFILNGCFGIFTKWHQNSPSAVPTLDFMLLYCALTVVSSTIILFIRVAYEHKHRQIYNQKDETAKNNSLSIESTDKITDKKHPILSWASVAGYAIVNGGAQLIVMLCAQHMDASVQYPIITGGCILFSVVTGLLFGEKVTIQSILRAFFAIAGTLLFMF